MKTNLIMVEGLPGSGKSTTAAMIAGVLKKKGKTVCCVDEGAPKHPADYADYDFPDFETEREKILAKWQSFVENAHKDTIYVFNCVFLQNPMCETIHPRDTESGIACRAGRDIFNALKNGRNGNSESCRRFPLTTAQSAGG